MACRKQREEQAQRKPNKGNQKVQNKQTTKTKKKNATTPLPFGGERGETGETETTPSKKQLVQHCCEEADILHEREWDHTDESQTIAGEGQVPENDQPFQSPLKLKVRVVRVVFEPIRSWAKATELTTATGYSLDIIPRALSATFAALGCPPSVHLVVISSNHALWTWSMRHAACCCSTSHRSGLRESPCGSVCEYGARMKTHDGAECPSLAKWGQFSLARGTSLILIISGKRIGWFAWLSTSSTHSWQYKIGFWKPSVAHEKEWRQWWSVGGETGERLATPSAWSKGPIPWLLSRAIEHTVRPLDRVHAYDAFSLRPMTPSILEPPNIRVQTRCFHHLSLLYRHRDVRDENPVASNAPPSADILTSWMRQT